MPDHQSKSSLTTRHGSLRFPSFLPDATRAVVRTLDSDDLIGCGVEALVVNAFHLQTHPGAGVVSSFGGIHPFMNWKGPILSDSGGFQVYSLLRENPRLGAVTERGFSYRSASGQAKTVLTPEKCIQKQFKLGSDIIVCLDYCTHPATPTDEQRRSVDTTVRWAQACRREHNRLSEQRKDPPLLFAVVQGGNEFSLREECAEALLEIGFDGYGFGGWPIGEGGRLVESVQRVAELLPNDSPKWALGIGKPEHVVAAARFGYGLFDCVIPTRDARHQRLYVYRDSPHDALSGTPDFYECVYIQDNKHTRDKAPVDEGCDCFCCRSYSRAYLHHLFKVGDSLAQRLATLHNLRFYTRLVEVLRTVARV